MIEDDVEWQDEPDTGLIEKMLDSNPPEAEKLARQKLHALVRKLTPADGIKNPWKKSETD